MQRLIPTAARCRILNVVAIVVVLCTSLNMVSADCTRAALSTCSKIMDSTITYPPSTPAMLTASCQAAGPFMDCLVALNCTKANSLYSTVDAYFPSAKASVFLCQPEPLAVFTANQACAVNATNSAQTQCFSQISGAAVGGVTISPASQCSLFNKVAQCAYTSVVGTCGSQVAQVALAYMLIVLSGQTGNCTISTSFPNAATVPLTIPTTTTATPPRSGVTANVMFHGYNNLVMLTAAATVIAAYIWG